LSVGQNQPKSSLRRVFVLSAQPTLKTAQRGNF